MFNSINKKRYSYNLIGDYMSIFFENDIIKTNLIYNYNLMISNINSLKKKYPFLKVGKIGKSVLNRLIPYIKIGIGKKQVLYQSAIHANEWITALLSMKFIENFGKAYSEDKNIFGYRAKDLFTDCSLYIIPMMNPDGVDLVTGCFSEDEKEYRNAKIISDKYLKIPFPRGWKANINGVDLNLQFPAGWEKSKKIKFSQGFTSPSPRDYVGKRPIFEPEAIALYDFTNKKNFRLTISFHSQGKVIYWRYLDYLPEKSLEIAKEFSKISGYELDDTPFVSSFAGYRDWFIKKYNRPAFTVEVGAGENPLPILQFNDIYSEIEGIFVLGTIL